MNRKTLALGTAAALALGATAWLAWPEAAPVEAEQTDDHAQEEGAEEDEGVVTLSPQQIADAGIEVAKVELGAGAQLLLPATVAASPRGIAVIDARASGVVVALSKTLGDTIRRGETVARIESAEAAALAAAVNIARAEASEQAAATRREKKLYDERITARQDLETAQAHAAVRQAELRRAQAAARAAGVSGDGRTLAVTSPLSGRVTAAPAVLGSFVEAGDELYRVIDPGALQVEVALPAADAVRIAPCDKASLILGEGREVAASVRSVTPSLDAESRSAIAVLALPRAVAGLQPGAFLQARLMPSGETDPNRIAVPEDAVQIVEGREVVFIRTKTGFRAQPVATGGRSGGRVTILSGLEPGKLIATSGAFVLKAELGKEGASHGH